MERVNQTLQDRLVKELRLAGVSDMETANAFLPTYMARHNECFAAAPSDPQDAHRPVLHTERELALSRHVARTLSKNLTCQYGKRQYQVTARGKGYALRGARITLCEAFNGEVTLLREGRPLAFRVLAEGEPPTQVADGKSVSRAVDEARARQSARPGWKPPADHLWRRPSVAAAAR